MRARDRSRWARVRVLLLFIAVLLGVAALAGCGEDDSDQAPQVTITGEDTTTDDETTTDDDDGDDDDDDDDDNGDDGDDDGDDDRDDDD
jgi:hypothetical protein